MIIQGEFTAGRVLCLRIGDGGNLFSERYISKYFKISVSVQGKLTCRILVLNVYSPSKKVLLYT